MIQRIQTVYLLLAFIALMLQFAIPYGVVPIGAESAAVPALVDGKFNLTDRVWLLIITIIAGGLAFAAVWLYPNRPLQSRITSFGIFSAAFLSIFLGTQFFTLANEAKGLMEDFHYRAGVGMPALSVFLLWKANQNIRRDQAKVEAANRLR